jgi:hypothetical protein
MRRFFKNIKRLFEWFPIIWKDQDWDQAYIYDILIYKIRRNAKNIRDNDYIQNAKYYADRMELAALLLERVVNDYYIDLGYECYETKSWIDENSNYQSKVVYVDAQEFFEKYPRECFKATIQSVDKVKIDEALYFNAKVSDQLGHNLHEKCKKLAFKIIEQDIDKWWW